MSTSWSRAIGWQGSHRFHPKALITIPTVGWTSASAVHRIPHRFGKDIEEMLRQRLTFGEAIAGFDLMPRTRIKRIRDDLWAQLDALPLGEDQAQSRAAASA